MLPPWGNWASSGTSRPRPLGLRPRLATGLPSFIVVTHPNTQRQELSPRTSVRWHPLQGTPRRARARSRLAPKPLLAPFFVVTSAPPLFPPFPSVPLRRGAIGAPPPAVVPRCPRAAGHLGTTHRTAGPHAAHDSRAAARHTGRRVRGLSA